MFFDGSTQVVGLGQWCELLNALFHDTWFADLGAYTLAQRCPTCRVESGRECDAPTRRTDPSLQHRQHIARQRLGGRHYMRDIRKAPWPEERVIRSYSTVPHWRI